MAPTTPVKSLSGIITSEGGLVETPGLDLLAAMGWTRVNLMEEMPGHATLTGRQSFRELVMPMRLRAALRKLNPSLPDDAVQQAELDYKRRGCKAYMPRLSG